MVMMVVVMMMMFLLRASHPTLSTPRPAAALTKATGKLVSRTICDSMQNNGHSKIRYSLSFLCPQSRFKFVIELGQTYRIENLLNKNTILHT